MSAYGDAETHLLAGSGEEILVRLYRQHSSDPDLQELGALVGFFLAEKPQYSLTVRRLEDLLAGDDSALALKDRVALTAPGLLQVRAWLKLETMDLFPPPLPGPAFRRSPLAG